VPDVPTPREVWRIVRLLDGAVTLTDNAHTADECRRTGRFRVERYLLVERAVGAGEDLTTKGRRR
jgi:hypothetical protein